MNYVLLLTATIHPYPSTNKAGRNNHVDRENDYYLAVKFYLSQGFKVVFVENSNTRSEKILALGDEFGSLEYHSFPTQKSHLGKSQGEVEIFHFALAHSNYLKEVEYLVKITGRYIIKNIKDILEPTNYISQELYINPTRNLRWADSRLMLMRKSFFYQYFIPAVDQYLDEEKKVYMENVFMKSLFLYLLDGGQLHLWPAYPAYDAYDGTFNDKVSFGYFKTFKYNLYYKLKKLAFAQRA